MTDSKALARTDNETAVVLEGITRAALDPAVDVAKLERLLDIQERLLADQRRTTFRAALARLQERLPQITKQGTILDGAGRARNKFAKLEDIDAVIRPLLAEEGFSFSFDSKTAPNGMIEFTCTLHHRDGHAETKTIALPVDNGAGRNAVQSVGSSTSYARRYLISMHLNLVTRDEDDDGAGGGHEPITSAQVAELRRLLDEAGGDPARFCRWLGVERVEDVRLAQYGRAIKFIEEKKRQRGGAK